MSTLPTSERAAQSAMATVPSKPAGDRGPRASGSAWPVEPGGPRPPQSASGNGSASDRAPNSGDALQALLAFSAMHQQVRRRRALALRHSGFEVIQSEEFEPAEHFVLDEVLQSVAERAISITGADGLGIALAENNEIVLPQTIAHRGYKKKYPENTMSAFTAAVGAGCHAIETDMHLSRDGVVVISHVCVQYIHITKRWN